MYGTDELGIVPAALEAVSTFEYALLLNFCFEQHTRVAKAMVW